MTFLKLTPALVAGFSLLAACGGGDNGTPASSEKMVEKREAIPQSSETAPSEPAPAPVAAAPGEPAAQFADYPEPYASADYARGRRTFKLCQSCHTLAEGGPNLVGPNLYGLFGRQVGSVAGFTYSQAVADADFVWSPEQLEEWLKSPRAFLPGNRMSFNGVTKEADRHAVIAYIMSETGYGK